MYGLSNSYCEKVFRRSTYYGNRIREDFNARDHVEAPELNLLFMFENEDKFNSVDDWEFRPVNTNECDFAWVQNGFRDNYLKYIQNQSQTINLHISLCLFEINKLC